MKKIKCGIMFLIVFCIFFSMKNVMATESLSCYYNTTGDNDSIEYHKGTSTVAGVMLINISYNSDTKTTPVLSGRIIKKSDFNLSDNGYSPEFTKDNTAYNRLDCQATDHMCINTIDSINVAELRNGRGELQCPQLYLHKFNKKDIIDPRSRDIYYLSFSADLTIVRDSADKVIQLSPDLVNSHIVQDQEIADSAPSNCSYEFNELLLGLMPYSGTLGFDIIDGFPSNIIVRESNLESSIFVYTGDKIEDGKCPSNMDFKVVDALSNYKVEFKPTASGEQGDSSYIGDVNNSDDNAVFLEYVLYNSSKANRVRIVKNGGSFAAKLKNMANDSTQDITIDNMADYDLTTEVKEDLPLYVVETINNDNTASYTFSNKTKYEANNYILKKLINDLYLKNGSSYDNTCRNLFGSNEDGFMNFLVNNVFRIVYIAVPIILILLTSFDFAKAVFNSDSDGMQGAFKKFGKRVVAAVLIYLVPTIVIFASNLVGGSEVADCARQLQNLNKEDGTSINTNLGE